MIPPCILMYITDNNKNIKTFVRYILYFIIASLFGVALGYSFDDDGLRHLAFANNFEIMKNWGNVYPHSLFGSYDPWRFWHHFLHFIISISSFEHAHIVVNIISLFVLMVLMDSILNLELKKYKNTIVLFVSILSILVYARYTNLRPDLLSGFFVLSLYYFSERYKNYKHVTFVLFFIALLYAPMYYLFFVYTLMFAMYFFMTSQYKNLFAMLFATVIGLTYYYCFFGKESLEIIKYVLIDEKLRDGMMVGEGRPLFGIIGYIGTLAWIIVYSAIMIYLKAKRFSFLKNDRLLTLISVASLLWIGQMRYYALFLPLFYLYGVILIVNMDVKQLDKVIQSIKYLYVAVRRTFIKNNRNISFILIFSLFIGFEYAQVLHSQNKEIGMQNSKMVKFFKDKRFNNSTILINTLEPIGYYALYANPTIHEIPSCSIGWSNGSKHFNTLYKKLLKKNITIKEFSEFVQSVKPDYIFLKLPVSKDQSFTYKKLSKYGFSIVEIFDKYLILRKK